MRRSLMLSLAGLMILANTAQAQRKEAVIVFKDGFFLSGKVIEPRSYILDPSGQSFTIPLSGALIHLDDLARRIYFIPGQLQEVIEKKEVNRDLLDLKRFAVTSRGDKILPGWQVETFTDFNSKWERTLKVHVVRDNYNNFFNMDQRIIQATPFFFRVQTLKYEWDLYHLTKEFGPEEVRRLLVGYFADKKDFKDWDRRKAIAMFMYQAGWHKEAHRELDSLVEEYAGKKDEVAGLQETIKKVMADIHVEDAERASKVGQHAEAQARLATYFKENMAALVNDKNQQLAQDLRIKYQSLNDKLGQAKATLTALPKRAPTDVVKYWTEAAETILDELNLDTLHRLETFLVFGQQYLREVEEKSKPSQSAEEVLALAISGWLLGNSSAEPDVKNARLLWSARAMVLDYPKTVNSVHRQKLLSSVSQSGNLSVDILARIIKNVPPAYPIDKNRTGIIKLPIDLADSRGGEYYLRLPPEYQHHRPYPVLLLLHGAREKPDSMIERLSELASKYGFIVAAPLWGGASARATYSYTGREHAVVLDTLRDLRRRVQVDSDRVFLFGFEQGANAALDIGMSHPDEFAGVLSMCGVPRFYTAETNRYQTNAQYLPFYLVEGDRNGPNPKLNCDVFKAWVRGTYPALYVEYKGRGSEWYGGELPRMFDWMSRKKRHQPAREMGRRNASGDFGEEFRTMRETDNRFYWLTTDSIDTRFINNPSSWVRTTPAASMLASRSVGNDLIVKPGGQKEAKIFTQFNIYTKGLCQVTLWLAPNMLDFTKPVRIRLNGSAVGADRIIQPNPAVLMEDFFYNGDRQRLYYNKIDLKI